MECSLPMYDFSKESDETNRIILQCLTQPCSDFSEGRCQFVRPPTCFFYHNVIHKRRPVVNKEGKLLYWDKICNSMSSKGGCTKGDMCEFAHTKTEITYHPAKFWTKLCNAVECRGTVCCFAHSGEKLRLSAYFEYSSLSRATRSFDSSRLCRSDSSDDASTVSSAVLSNRLTGLYMITHLCIMFPDKIAECEKGDKCEFVHSLSELLTPLLDPGIDDFYQVRFKTHWCPSNELHDWNVCIYGHNWTDMRRPPKIGYGPLVCPVWEASNPQAAYNQRCLYGLRCPFSHGMRETMYHPSHYKVNECGEWSYERGCQRGDSCAFYHDIAEKRVNNRSTIVYAYDKLLDKALVEKECAHLCCRPTLISAADLREANKPRATEYFAISTVD